MNCPLCNSGDEDEVHFVLCCPAFDDRRKQFILLKYYRHTNLFQLGLLLAMQNGNILRNLCVYLYKAFKRRSVVIFSNGNVMTLYYCIRTVCMYTATLFNVMTI